MECTCGGHAMGSYQRYNTVREAEIAGFSVERAPCVIVLKDCPSCKRHSQDVWYSETAMPKTVNLLGLLRK